MVNNWNEKKTDARSLKGDKKQPYFYFDLSAESHKKIAQKELEEAREAPLEPLQQVTKVEY